MAIGDTYTTGLKSFIENNANAGYIRTSSEITTSDIAAAVSQIIGNEYVKSNQLAQVATSGNYNHLSNLPTLHRVASSGDYFDLINRPTFHEVATSGDYNKLINKPDIESRVDTEVSTLISTAISDLRTEIKGSGLNSNYDTLAKLQNAKGEVVYLDVTIPAYGSLSNFGNTSFYKENNSALVDTIINNFLDNKIIILQSNYGNFVVSNLLNDNNYTEISLLRFSTNYNTLYTQFQVENPSGTYSDYVLSHITTSHLENFIIYDKARHTVFYIIKNKEYITNNDLGVDLSALSTAITTQGNSISAINTSLASINSTIDSISSSLDTINSNIDAMEFRIEALEGIDPTNSEPDEPEPEEP